MTNDPTTGNRNGKLWGERAGDWAAIQEGTCRGVYEAVLARFAGRDLSYLDAGCGAGMALQMAAAQGARVSGLDASEALLAIARSRVPSADLRQGELEALPFADASFDLVTGFNSFQYASNPRQALLEARRVAIPGATVVVMTWGEPSEMPAAQLVAALKRLLPAPLPGAPGPFALSEKSALSALAESAHLTSVEFLDVDCPWVYPDLETALRGLGSSGVAARRASTPALRRSTGLMPMCWEISGRATAVIGSGQVSAAFSRRRRVRIALRTASLPT